MPETHRCRTGRAALQIHLPGTLCLHSGGLGWLPIRVGNPHQRERFLWPHFLIALQFSFSRFSLAGALPKYHHALPKTMLAQKGLESSCIRSIFPPSLLFLPSRPEGLEGHMERKAVLAERCHKHACPVCSAVGTSARVKGMPSFYLY